MYQFAGMQEKYVQRIQDWAVEERPREKMMRQGREALSNTELLAIIIRSGQPGINALDLSRQILANFSNDLSRLARSQVGELARIPGVGPAKAACIHASLELGTRKMRTSTREYPKISCSRDLWQEIRGNLEDLDHEQFWVIFLNRANRILDKVQISKGGISGTIADPRLIFRLALEKRATSLILCHNHPSGQLVPSQSDRVLTEKIRKAGELFDIQVLDHLILGGSGYLSFADKGMM